MHYCQVNVELLCKLGNAILLFLSHKQTHMHVDMQRMPWSKAYLIFWGMLWLCSLVFCYKLMSVFYYTLYLKYIPPLSNETINFLSVSTMSSFDRYHVCTKHTVAWINSSWVTAGQICLEIVVASFLVNWNAHCKVCNVLFLK